MGTDIYSECGIILSKSEIIKIVNGKNKETIIDICQDFYDEIKNDNDEIKDHFEKLNKISSKIKIKDLQEILDSLIIVDGQPSKYDTETNVRYSYCILELFSEIIKTIPELPSLKDVTAFGSSRLNGYTVPLGIACFIFQSDDCYEKVLTKKGKFMKKIFGHCNETEWTIISY